MLYAAYGSNLHKHQMAKRCPKARAYRTVYVGGWKLQFSYHATIVRGQPSDLLGLGLWYITSECERALDRYEGVSSGYYRKEYFTFEGSKVLVYIMNSDHLELPDQAYYHTLSRGFGDFNIPHKLLEDAYEEAELYGEIPLYDGMSA